MFKRQPYQCTGHSGRSYTFTLLTRSDPLPEEGGLLLLAYTHPRGHLAGFEVHPLLLVSGPDLRAALPEGEPADCAVRECWNCNGVLPMPNAEDRESSLRDLEPVLDTPCTRFGK